MSEQGEAAAPDPFAGWVKITPYSIGRGPWRVSKVFVRESAGYMLWRHNGRFRTPRYDLVSHLAFPTALSAIERAAQLEPPPTEAGDV